ncbi:MAG TPA: GAF domain-containing protein [Gemmatimonadaceae bacterium]|nr:GAF domain-containing protein [Gemmatimonadaceae bacterium]
MTSTELDRDVEGGSEAALSESDRLRERVAALERERDHLVAVVDILTAISASQNFVDVLQIIARKLGSTFGLDRCSIYLAGDSQHVRLVASYEDPSMGNLVVDLDRYPELKRAFESGETVFIPDASVEPMYQGVQMMIALRNVRSIVVVPIRWRGTVIGAIFLRTERDAAPFLDRDVRFCQVIASLTANALRNAHRFETIVRGQQTAEQAQRRAELQRIALIAFVRRLLDRYTNAEDHMWAETLLPTHADDELDRLVSVALEVIGEEAKG